MVLQVSESTTSLSPYFYWKVRRMPSRTRTFWDACILNPKDHSLTSAHWNHHPLPTTAHVLRLDRDTGVKMDVASHTKVTPHGAFGNISAAVLSPLQLPSSHGQCRHTSGPAPDRVSPASFLYFMFTPPSMHVHTSPKPQVRALAVHSEKCYLLVSS